MQRVDIAIRGEDQIVVECAGGPTICLEQVTPGKVVRSAQAGLERQALFVTDTEAAVLAKMARYALEKLKLSEQSRTLLQGLLPLLDSIGGDGRA